MLSILIIIGVVVVGIIVAIIVNFGDN